MGALQTVRSTGKSAILSPSQTAVGVWGTVEKAGETREGEFSRIFFAEEEIL
jgi:hypothetical protein